MNFIFFQDTFISKRSSPALTIITKEQTGQKSPLRLGQSALFWYNWLRAKTILGKCALQNRHSTLGKQRSLPSSNLPSTKVMAAETSPHWQLTGEKGSTGRPSAGWILKLQGSTVGDEKDALSISTSVYRKLRGMGVGGKEFRLQI